MSEAFLRHIRKEIRSKRALGLVAMESKYPPKELRLSMCILEYPEFPNCAVISFLEGKTLMLYPVFGNDLESWKNKFKEKEKEWYPHLANYMDEWEDTGDIFKENEKGEWLISDEVIERRHKIVDEIGKDTIVEYLKRKRGE